MANPYQVLNAHPEATEEQIEEAYYKMRWMVSYGSAVNAVSEETLNTAYAILRDPDRRARLDKALEKRRKEGHR